MKRIQAACLEQTVHFQVREPIPPDVVAAAVRQEYDHYRDLMDRRRIPYRILEEATQPDGSLVIKIKKQYNNQPVGPYLEE